MADPQIELASLAGFVSSVLATEAGFLSDLDEMVRARWESVAETLEFLGDDAAGPSPRMMALEDLVHSLWLHTSPHAINQLTTGQRHLLDEVLRVWRLRCDGDEGAEAGEAA